MIESSEELGQRDFRRESRFRAGDLGSPSVEPTGLAKNRNVGFAGTWTAKFGERASGGIRSPIYLYDYSRFAVPREIALLFRSTRYAASSSF